jgi:hypothetical protein
MPDITFKIEKMRSIDAEITYARNPGEGGRLKVRFTSEKMLDSYGSQRRFGLDFNAIGETNPEVFLASLDEGYLNDKVSGLPGAQPDFFETVMNVRQTAVDPEYELSAKQRIEVEQRIDEIAKAFDGDHSLYSRFLIDSVSRMDLPCFQDDVYHLIGARQKPENLLFHMEIWPDFQEALGDFFDANMDIYEKIEAIVEGRDIPEASEEEMQP